VTDGDTNDHSSAAHRKLIDLAAVSSKRVYGISDSSLMFKKHERFQAVGPGENLAANLFFGTMKAMHVRLPGADLNNSGRLTPVVVVEIRGTASVRDWSVNFNHSSNSHTQASDFLVSMSHFVFGVLADGLFRVKLQKIVPTRSILAIWSLLYNQSVSAFEEAILRLLLDQSLTRFLQPPQFLFTGHSAGGTVASILYAHLNNRNQHSLSSIQNRTNTLLRLWKNSIQRSHRFI
jgi:hypothetical protein